MNPRFKILLAIVMFVGFTFLLHSLFATQGQPLTEWKVMNSDQNELLDSKEFTIRTAPFSEKVHQIGVYQLSTIFYPEDMAANVISIPRINGYAFDVTLNGQFLFQRGDIKVPTANLWNHAFLIDIPEGLLQKENSLILHVHALNDIGFIMVPAIGRRFDLNFRTELQNLLTEGASYMITGASFTLGIILLFLGFGVVKNKRLYYQFGLSFIFFSIYNYEFIYREYTGSLEVYLWVRKFLLLSILMSLWFLFQGILTYLYQYALPRKIHILYGIICFPLLLATSFPMLRDMIALYNFGVILLVLCMIILIIRSNQSKLVFSVSFVLLTILHSIIVFAFNLYTIILINYGIIVMLLSLTYHIILDIGNLQRENLRLNKKSQMDTLTKAYNREHLDLMEYHNYDTIIFIDLDHFKQYNDTYGHYQGDVLLQEFVELIEKGIRGEDAIIRYGGDEFVIVLKHTPLLKAQEKMESFREAFVKKFDLIDVSYGLSQYTESIHQTLRVADKYMYRMKEGKKARQGTFT